MLFIEKHARLEQEFDDFKAVTEDELYQIAHLNSHSFCNEYNGSKSDNFLGSCELDFKELKIMGDHDMDYLKQVQGWIFKNS